MIKKIGVSPKVGWVLYSAIYPPVFMQIVIGQFRVPIDLQNNIKNITEFGQ